MASETVTLQITLTVDVPDHLALAEAESIYGSHDGGETMSEWSRNTTARVGGRIAKHLTQAFPEDGDDLIRIKLIEFQA